VGLPKKTKELGMIYRRGIRSHDRMTDEIGGEGTAIIDTGGGQWIEPNVERNEQIKIRKKGRTR
jgi:hypothetical protein